MLIKLNDNVYINPEHISAIGVAGAKNEGGLPMASITMHCGDTLRVPAEGLIEALADAGVIASRGAEAITLTGAEIEELRDLREQGYKYIAQDADGRIYAYEDKPAKNAAYWEDGGDFVRLKEPYFNLPDMDKTPLSITALLQEVARE